MVQRVLCSTGASGAALKEFGQKDAKLRRLVAELSLDKLMKDIAT